MARKRKRVLGGWAGLCSTFIAKLAGCSPATIRTELKKYGLAKKNTLTTEMLGTIIAFQRNKKKISELRRELEKY